MQPLIMAKILPHQFIVGHESQLNAAFDEVFRGEKRLAEPLSVSINSIRMQWFGNRHIPSSSDQHATRIQTVSTYSRDRCLEPPEDPYTKFYSNAMIDSRQNRCWARGCQQYGEPGASKLMRCARCRAFQYCSRQRQRAHWKDVVRPHRDVCSTLARIQDAYPFSTGEENEQAFSAACYAAGILVEELIRPFWHFRALIIPYISEAEGLKSASPVFYARILVLTRRFAVARRSLDLPLKQVAVANGRHGTSDKI